MGASTNAGRKTTAETNLFNTHALNLMHAHNCREWGLALELGVLERIEDLNEIKMCHHYNDQHLAETSQYRTRLCDMSHDLASDGYPDPPPAVAEELNKMNPAEANLLVKEVSRLVLDDLYGGRDNKFYPRPGVCNDEEEALQFKALTSKVFKLLPSPSSKNVRPAAIFMQYGDPRRFWLEAHFQRAFRPHLKRIQNKEWDTGPVRICSCPVAIIRVLGVAELLTHHINSYHFAVLKLRKTRKANCAKVPELDEGIAVQSESGSDLNEMLLYYGCKSAYLSKLLANGFEPNSPGNEPTPFGSGCYFFTTASKPDFYTDSVESMDRPQFKSHRVMIVARVALGEIYEARQFGRRRLGSQYDSVMGVPRERGGCVEYDEFCVKPERAVPQFAIYYRHEENCECKTCLAT